MDCGSFEVLSSRYKALDAEIVPLPGAGRRLLTNLYGHCRHDGDTIRIVSRRPSLVVAESTTIASREEVLP